MNSKIILRRHIITLLPDTFLFFVSFLFLLALEMVRTQNAPALEEVCVISAFFFSMIGVLDILKWYGFSVTLTPACIEVRQFWVHKKEYCRDEKGERLAIRPVQTTWDEWLNKGTLVLYEPGGEVATLDNLSNFRSVFSIMRH
jgi:predicted membrane protein